jgi:hypothetical protein
VSDAQTREAVIERSFSRRSTFLQLRRALLRPRFFVILALSAVTYIGLAIVDSTIAIVFPPVFLACLLLTLGVSVVLSIRLIDRAMPAGSTIRVGLTDSTVVVATPSSSSETPFSSLSAAVRDGDFVVLQYGVSSRLIGVLPGSLFSDDDLRRLDAEVAGRAGGQQLPIADSTAFTIDHWYTTDAEFVSHAASTLTLHLALRPRSLALQLIFFAYGAILLLFAVFAVAFAELNDDDASVSSVIGALVLGTVLTLLPLGTVGLSRVRIGRQLRRAIPVGSRYGLALGDKKITVQAPLNAGQIEYSRFRRVRKRADFVFLVPRFGTRLMMLPAQLFPAGVLDSLTDKIEHATR